MSAFKHVIPPNMNSLDICNKNLANSQKSKISAQNESFNNVNRIAYNCSGKASSPADLTNNLSSFSNSLIGLGGSFLTGYS